MGSDNVMSVAEMFSHFFNSSIGESAVISESLEELQDSGEDYLCRNERILSLARETFQKKTACLELSEMEQELFSFVPTKDDTFFTLVSKLSRKCIRPLLRAMEAPDDEYAKKLIEIASSPFSHLEISFNVCEPEIANITRVVSAKNVPSEDQVLEFRFFESYYKEPLVVYGMKNTTHASKFKNAIMRTGFCIADLADFISSVFIHKTVVLACMNIVSSSAGELGISASVAQDIAECVQQYQEDYFSLEIYYRHKGEWNIGTQFSTNLPLYRVSVPDGKFISAYEDILAYFAEDDVEVVAPRKKMNGVVYDQSTSTLVFNSNSQWIRLFPCLLLKRRSWTSYRTILTLSTSSHLQWVIPTGVRYRRSSAVHETLDLSFYCKIFSMLAKEKNGIVEDIRYMKSLKASSKATCYQQKKDVSKAILKEMRLSGFNDYFGYVEFDKALDTKLVSEIFREFEAVRKAYFPNSFAKDYAIRFRRLGNYKAAGLFFPSLHCLCVDINNPHSLIHEYGHLIDYDGGCLSQRDEFSGILRAYLSELDQEMDNNEDFRAKMQGNTKYSYSYFSRPTEVFARCFELYISKCKGVINSIVPTSFEDGIYPQNEDFLRLVESYFDSLLGNQLLEKAV